MYVVVRRYAAASALVDVMVQREQEVRDLISTVPGFRAYYAARTGGGGVMAALPAVLHVRHTCQRGPVAGEHGMPADTACLVSAGTPRRTPGAPSTGSRRTWVPYGLTVRAQPEGHRLTTD